MYAIARALLVVLSLFLLSATAQEVSDREFLRQIDVQKRIALTDRYKIKMAEYEYFANPGKIGIYEFDIGVLETKGETITISPFNGPPIEFVSHGLVVNHDRGGHAAKWKGELPIPGSKQMYPVQLVMGIRAIDADGNVRKPDPNREVTRRLLEQENYAVLRESYERRKETIVYGMLRNEIHIPETKATLVINRLGDSLLTEEDFQSVVVYEVDNEKVLWPADDLPVEGYVNNQLDEERARRKSAFDTHMENVKREIANGQIEK